MPPPITPQQRETLRALLNETPASLTRREFDKLTPRQKSEFFRDGGKLHDDAQTAGRKHSTLTRAEFFRLPDGKQREYCALGLPLRP